MEKSEYDCTLRTSKTPVSFEIKAGWNGCCKYESYTFDLNKEECKQLIKELEEYVKEN